MKTFILVGLSILLFAKKQQIECVESYDEPLSCRKKECVLFSSIMDVSDNELFIKLKGKASRNAGFRCDESHVTVRKDAGNVENDFILETLMMSLIFKNKNKKLSI